MTIMTLIADIRNIDDYCEEGEVVAQQDDTQKNSVSKALVSNAIIDNTDDLFKRMKDAALKDDSFDTFMRVMNKFLKLNESEQSKEIWKLLDEVITKMIAGNFSTAPEKKKKKVVEGGNQNLEQLETKLIQASQ